jgi:hypothetical protein
MCPYYYEYTRQPFGPFFPGQPNFMPPPFGGPFQPPFGGPFQPPFGGPNPPPFEGPGQPPFGGPSQVGGPSAPPPTFTPQKPLQAEGIGVYAVDPGAIRRCLFRYVYLWLRNGQQFWAWLVFVGRQSASGYRWNGFRWVYFGVDLRQIDYFQCY